MQWDSTDHDAPTAPTVLLVVLATFVTLKLTGAIAWSWWWVLTPLWGPFALLVACAPLWLVAKLLESLWAGYHAERRAASNARFGAWMAMQGHRRGPSSTA